MYTFLCLVFSCFRVNAVPKDSPEDPLRGRRGRLNRDCPSPTAWGRGWGGGSQNGEKGRGEVGLSLRRTNLVEREMRRFAFRILSENRSIERGKHDSGRRLTG